MKQFLTGFMAVLFLQTITAQNIDKRISGVVRNMQMEPASGATATLTHILDSSFLQGRVVNNKGHFEFSNLANGIYILTVTGIGNEKSKSMPITIDNDHSIVRLPVIVVTSAVAADLKAVTVTAKRALITQDIDKTIVNVEAMIGSATSNTLEVLEKVPGVTVGTNGEIVLNGKGSVLVLIDGRATYFSSSDLAAYLRSLPGSLLEKIELMDNPSSKYDAAGSAVINIRFKKNKIKGFTGNIDVAYSQGKYGRHNESVNLNYNHKKVNLFGSLSHSREDNYTSENFDRRFYDEDGSPVSSVQLQNLQKYSMRGKGARIGMDYSPSVNTVFGFIVNINSFPRNGRLEYNSKSSDTGNKPDSSGLGAIRSNDDRKNQGINLNYLHKINDQGREIAADLNYISYQSHGLQYLSDFRYMPGSGPDAGNTFFYDLPGTVGIFTTKADYVHPMKHRMGLEAGLKSSVVSTDNDSRYFSVDANINTLDYGRSNHFIYKENINAAYVNMRKNWKKIGMQAGLRLENTMLNGDQLENDQTAKVSFSRSYTRFFPTVFMSYKLDSAGNNTLTTSIARRVNRPNYQQLNPFLAFRDNYSYTTGNPLLNPQYQYRYELKYQHKQFLGLGLQYGRFRDVIFQTTRAEGDIFISRPDNVAIGYMLILSTNLSFNPATWWSVNANFQLSHLAINGMAYTEEIKLETNVGRISVMNQFKLKKGWSAELSGFYSSKDIQAQLIVDPRYRVYSGVQKKIIKDRGAIKMTIEDIFRSWIQEDNSVGIKQSESHRIYRSDTRRIAIAISWRFGKDNFSRKRRHNDNAADSEKERVN